MAKKIDIAGTLNAATTDGVLGFSEQIKDESKGKMQSSLNKEFGEGIDRIERKSDIAYNAVKTLEGLSNANEAMQTLAGQVLQIEENKQNIASNKADADKKFSELGSEVVNVESRKQDTITISNLLNPNDDGYIEGFYIGSKGELNTSEGYAVSNYIPLTRSNQKAILARKGKKENTSGGFVAYYDWDKKFISATIMKDSAVATWFEGVSYVRFSISRYKEGENQIVYGDSIIDYIPYGNSILDDSVTIKGGNIKKLIIGTESIKAESVTPTKTTFFRQNLFNPNDENYLADSYFSDAKGSIGVSSNYAISGYIPFDEGNLILSVNGKVSSMNGGYNIYYNENKEVIGGEINTETSQIATWFEGVAFVRFSIRSPRGEVMIERGSKVEEYIPYTENPLLNRKNVPEATPFNESVSVEKLTSDFSASKSPNLLNLEDCILNSYAIVRASDRTYYTASNSNLITSGLIKVKPNTNYSYSMGHSYIPLDKDKLSLVDAAISAGGTKTITTPEGCEYLIINYYRYRDDLKPYNFFHTNRLYEGDIVFPYTPYGIVMGESFRTKSSLQTDSLLGSDGVKLSTEFLNNAEVLTMEKELYPKSIKRNQIAFSAKIVDFSGGIQVGRGFTAYNSGYFKITDTSISLIRYEGSESIKETVQHGLNISDYIKVIISERLDKALLVIQTLGGVFSQEFEYASAYNGQIAAKSLGASLSDVELCASNGTFKHQVWMFGDSYYGADSEYRQLHWLKKWGMLNCLVQSYAGQDSVSAYHDLGRCIYFGCPKYIVWSLGMNDDNSSDLDDITTGTWYKYFVLVKQLCELNGITLICCTIPEVRDSDYKNKDKMSEIVRNSGLRYIDVAKAVGSNSEGQWYGEGTEYDYQSTDNVHPSEYGASAIATQFLVDFPELMQY